MRKNEESYYIHQYTLRDSTTKSIKIEPGQSLKEEVQVLGIKDSDIFQIQMITNSNIALCPLIRKKNALYSKAVGVPAKFRYLF
ncbi:hypothetical protein AALF16_21200 [Bacillus cereus]|uniref:hypothetical protein n=1 Tax=Bacillus cereus TaxID=1396 RepID=UPI00356FAD99